MITRGLFDLQVNGFAGVDFNSVQMAPDALDHALQAMWQSGVTQCLPTITAPERLLADHLTALDRAVASSRFGPAMVPGYHLEEPFLSPEAGGSIAGPSHPAAHPQGACGLIRWAHQRRKIVARGHTTATSTGASPTTRRGNGLLGCTLADTDKCRIGWSVAHD